MEIIDNKVNNGDVFVLNNNGILVINTIHDNKYIYNIVSFIMEDKKMYIGHFCGFNYGYSNEWIEYNDNYIFFLSHINTQNNNENEVYLVFDIKNR